jgi:hypothetical protein
VAQNVNTKIKALKSQNNLVTINNTNKEVSEGDSKKFHAVFDEFTHSKADSC